MYASLIVNAVVGLLPIVASALPHDLMVNNEFVRDVGILYSNSNFTGDQLYLVMHKKAPKCENAISFQTSLGSAQICVAATCIFYKSNDCTLSGPGSDHYFQGPVDVDNLQTLPDIACDSYMCGSINDMNFIIGNTTGAFADSKVGLWGTVGRH